MSIRHLLHKDTESPLGEAIVAAVPEPALIRKCRVHSFCREVKAVMIRLVMTDASRYQTY